MAIYYVNTLADAGGDGTTNATTGEHCAWDTIADATLVLTAGDTVLIRAGTYEERVMLTTGNSGTDANRIIYKNYLGETPIMDGTSFGWGSSFMSGRYASPAGVVNYITFDGLEIRDYPEAGIVLDRNQTAQAGCVGSHGITVKNCIIHNNVGNGVLIEGGDVGTPGNEGYGHLITLNTVYANASHGIKFTGDDSGTINRVQIRDSIISYNTVYGQTGDTGIGQGIHVSTGSHGITIAHNVCYLNGTCGISTFESWDDIIEYNTCHTNGQVSVDDPFGIVCWKASNNIIRNNLVYDNPVAGIRINGDLAGSPTACSIYSNIVYGNGATASGEACGIHLNNSLAHDVYNNTVSNNHNAQIYVQTTANHNIKNNILYSVGGGAAGDYLIRSDVTAGWTANKINYNCYYTTDLTNPWYWGANKNAFATWQTDASMDTNGMSANPLMVDPGNGDFHLQSGSPCKDTGANVGLIRDYAGKLVPINSTPDIGAHEFQGLSLSFNPTLVATVSDAASSALALASDATSKAAAASDMASSALVAAAGGSNALSKITTRSATWDKASAASSAIALASDAASSALALASDATSKATVAASKASDASSAIVVLDGAAIKSLPDVGSFAVHDIVYTSAGELKYRYSSVAQA